MRRWPSVLSYPPPHRRRPPMSPKRCRTMPRRRGRAAEPRDRGKRAASNIDALANNPGSPSIGAPQADITIVEFFDYACPYCKAIEPRLEALVQHDKGIKLVLKEFPILTKQSMIASRMALAAVKQGKYAPFHLAMMR